jgi:phosphoenolpyruvate-protein kinase (PTS system EI component)
MLRCVLTLSTISPAPIDIFPHSNYNKQTNKNKKTKKQKNKKTKKQKNKKTKKQKTKNKKPHKVILVLPNTGDASGIAKEGGSGNGSSRIKVCFILIFNNGRPCWSVVNTMHDYTEVIYLVGVCVVDFIKHV